MGYRVKYLDFEDIESFGFTRDASYSHKLGADYYIEYNPKDIQSDTIEIKDNGNTLFSGKIKNKSQLEVILKQVMIL